MKAKKIDYEAIYQMLLKGPVSMKNIKEKLHLTSREMYDVVINLTYEYPIWQPKRGWLKLSEPQDDVKWKAGHYDEEEI